MGFSPRLPPFLRKLKRGPAVILPKDAGYIIAHTGVGKESVVVECGGGSGFLTVQLAKVCKKLITFEKRIEFAEIIKLNLNKMSIDNVTLVVENFFDVDLDETIDLLVLDMKDADKAIKHGWGWIKEFGWACAYLPNIEQAKNFYLTCEELEARELSLVEIIKREYEVREQGVRPKHLGLMHTAYLVFAQKPKNKNNLEKNKK
jgi:tRNA (adenine57-N1/adenine58-N1)-methyltransferase